ncbi:MAG: oligosaccharide flippase family protein [Alphaproteobacteria bacterium]|nr:oligosaccharide flippase family protein [Alphaproteobacteria bacterium]
MTHSVGQRVAAGAALMVLLKTAVRLIGIASILILVRVLDPDDFGIVALAFVTVSILESVTEPLIQPYLIRAERPDNAVYDCAWTLGVLRGVAIGAVIAAAGPLAAWSIDEPRLVPLMAVFALTPVLQGLENVGMVGHMRDLRYDVVLVWRLSSKIAGTLTTIPLAIIFASYWALAAGIVAGRVVSLIASYWLSDYRPRPRLSGAGDMVHFAKWMFGYGILDTIESYLMTVMLGRLAGSGAVGTFNVAYTVAAMPCSEIAAPVREPLYAALAAARDRPSEFAHQYLTGLGLLTLIVLPMSVGIALVAPQLVPVALGATWTHATVLVQLCALYALLDALSAYTINLFLVRGRVRQMVMIFAALLAVRVPAAIWGFHAGGIDGAAAGLLGTALLGAIVWHVMAARMLGVPVRALAGTMSRSIGAAAAMSAAVIALQRAPALSWLAAEPVLWLVLLVAGGAVVHIVAQAALWRAAGLPAGPETQAVRQARALWNRLAGRAGLPQFR